MTGQKFENNCWTFLFSLVQVAIGKEEKEMVSGRQRRASESDTPVDPPSNGAGVLKNADAMPKNVDILQMLSKAQDEYDKVCFYHSLSLLMGQLG